jgi:hypothetical protein
MNAELVFFGCSISMAQRSRRRTLVVLMYGAFATLMAALWYFTHWRGTGAYVIWAAILACRFFLGGYYSRGLVKPFNSKAPRETAMPPTLLALKLRVYQPVLAAGDSAYRNDERELHQRDHAHYLAFQAAGIALCVPMFVASLRIIKPALLGWIPISPDEMYYGLTLIGIILFLTLPQSILLWTEPDMEDAQATS